VRNIAKLTEAGAPRGCAGEADDWHSIPPAWSLVDPGGIVAGHEASGCLKFCAGYLSIAIAGCSPASLTFNRSKRDTLYGHSAFVDRDLL